MENERNFIENESTLIENDRNLIENEGNLIENERSLIENERNLLIMNRLWPPLRAFMAVRRSALVETPTMSELLRIELAQPPFCCRGQYSTQHRI